LGNIKQVAEGGMHPLSCEIKEISVMP
jgi:hypothetical protein